MIIVGGAFLLAPGFITDVIGFLLLIPPTRACCAPWSPASPAAGCRSGSWGPHPAPVPARRRAPAARARARRSPGYDYEGTAHEVTDDRELEVGERRE